MTITTSHIWFQRACARLSFVGLLGLVEAILVIVDADGRRIGDKTGGTQVIEALGAEV